MRLPPSLRTSEVKEIEIISSAKVTEIKTELNKEEKVETPPLAEATEVKEKTIHVLDIMPEEDEADEKTDKVKEEVLLARSLKLKPIKNLISGIGINDRFMITNDLFEGITKEFNASVKKLDSQKDMQQALYLLSDMKDENLWESEDKVFQIFKTYIERRYI